MKKILAVTLAILMLLPMFASFAYAGGITIPEGTPVKNIAGDASISVEDTNGLGVTAGDAKLDWIVDGNKETGTIAPNGKQYSYVLEFDEVRYFTEIVVACNGSGTLSNGNKLTTDTYNITKLRVTIFDGEDITYQSEPVDVSELKELVVNPEAKGDKIQVNKISGKGTFYKEHYMWEIEAYSPDMELCDARVQNVATEAVFSATGGNANYWWAMDYKTWVDGDPNTGSHSPKGRNYSVWMHFSQEYLFSQIDLVCNTEGGAKLASGATIDDRYIGNSMLRVRVYNYNEDLVWDSDLVDTSTITTLSVSPYVEGAIIEICFFNGNYGGGEYMYEVSAYAQSGDHVFEKVSEENPTCLLPGYKELLCHCGKNIKQSIPATGFHKWNTDAQEVTKGASDTENGVLSIPCDTCDSYKLRDVPAIGHNWNDGVTVAPSCDKEGYVLYTCKDAGCGLSYKADYTDALQHNWDEGKITKFPTVTEEGVLTYTCSICKGEKYGRIRKHKYTDNVTDFTSASIVKTDVVINKEDSQYTADYTGGTPGALFDKDMGTNWYGPSGTYVVFTLDRNYIFTSGFFYMSANWGQAEVQFLNEKDEVVAKFNTGNVDHFNANNPKQLDMLDALGGGTMARKIKVISVSAKWANGSAATMHELRLKVHSCKVSEVDYILSGSDYKAPQCGKDGSCKAKCQVCGNLNDVVIKATADNSHVFDMKDVVADIDATCSTNGFGHVQCKSCNKTVDGITIPSTGEHDFSDEEIVVSAKCGFAGVGNKVCVVCGTVGSIFEIPPTGVHSREWKVQSKAAYTAVGKTVYSCIYCDDVSEVDPETGINEIVDEKLQAPADLLTFVGASKNDGALTLTYKIKLEYLPEIEYTCDVRVITTIKDALGREATVESYGKYATNSYNAETGEFSVTFYPKNAKDVFEVSTAVRLMNFRGIVYTFVPMGNYGTSISINAIK